MVVALPIQNVLSAAGILRFEDLRAIVGEERVRVLDRSFGPPLFRQRIGNDLIGKGGSGNPEPFCFSGFAEQLRSVTGGSVHACSRTRRPSRTSRTGRVSVPALAEQ